MRPQKTDLARQTLQSHRGTLGMRERRALILCDGQRDLAELVGMLGADAAALLRRLEDGGYLTRATPAPAATLESKAPPTTPRRSLVAARVYLAGMLELHRDDEAAAYRRQLQSCPDDATTVSALAAALQFLQSRVAVSLAHRIRERLAEVLPQEYLHALGTGAPAQTEAALD
jgi:hypothetical protein